jgi:hypothetical protein
VSNTDANRDPDGDTYSDANGNADSDANRYTYGNANRDTVSVATVGHGGQLPGPD